MFCIKVFHIMLFVNVNYVESPSPQGLNSDYLCVIEIYVMLFVNVYCM